MFLAFKLSFVVDSMAFFGLDIAWATFQKIWQFFLNLLVTLTGDKQQFASGISEVGVGRVMD
jgi:hypothetical protein